MRVEGNIVGGAMREPPTDPARSKNPGMFGISMRENREIPPSPAQLITGRAAQGRQSRKPEMYEDGKSYSPVVPANPPNKALAAEAVEERGLAKGNTAGKTRSGLRAGTRVSHALARVRQVAERDQEVKFTALLHHVTVERLRDAYRA